MRSVVFVAAITLALNAAAADALVAGLEQRLARTGVETVNAYLRGDGSSVREALHRKTADCELEAVSLTIRLGRGADARAAQAHREALRAAVGKCTAFVLALALQQEVPGYCASSDAWSVMQTARDLRRRIAAIEADALLRSTRAGTSCRAAYLHELRHTRVVLKSLPLTPSAPGPSPAR